MTAETAQSISGVVRLLPDLVINQISAGEVVDRPASVVRELVDNSIDAGSTEISVYLEEGGSGLIRVVDNGCGMLESDARLAFERHATSKISSADDLLAISTLGFRGEALPSIASVSRVRLRTQPSGAPSGTQVLINGGSMERVESCTIRNGTDIEIRSLFYNTPARKKFLRTARTEEAKVKTWLRQSAVAHPQVHYRFFSEGREVFNLPPRESSVARAREIFKGASIALAEKVEHLEIEGLVAHPSLAEGEGNAFVLLVNGRLVNDRAILRAVREGFDSTLKPQEYPTGFVALTIAPHLVDVNVHPQKSEVRFIAPQSIFTLVRSVVRHAVMRFSEALPQEMLRRPTSESSFSGYGSHRPAPLQLIRPASSSSSGGGAGWAAQNHLFSASLPESTGSETNAPAGQPAISFSDLRYIGQTLECFLLAEHEGRLYAVDMHAAHERIMFNKIRSQRLQREKRSQLLLIPTEVSLTEENLARIQEWADLLTALGFAFDEKGSDLCIREIPEFLTGADLPALFQELCALPEHAPAGGIFEEYLDHIIARRACHSSIRSGRSLEREEAYALFRQMDQEDLANACPHGRPVIVSFSRDEIEQWFGRDR